MSAYRRADDPRQKPAPLDEAEMDRAERLLAAHGRLARAAHVLLGNVDETISTARTMAAVIVGILFALAAIVVAVVQAT